MVGGTLQCVTSPLHVRNAIPWQMICFKTRCLALARRKWAQMHWCLLSCRLCLGELQTKHCPPSLGALTCPKAAVGGELHQEVAGSSFARGTRQLQDMTEHVTEMDKWQPNEVTLDKRVAEANTAIKARMTWPRGARGGSCHYPGAQRTPRPGDETAMCLTN